MKLARHLVALVSSLLPLLAFAADLTGRYAGALDGETALMVLKQQDNRLTGAMQVGNELYELNGIVDRGVARGKMIDRAGGTELEFTAAREDGDGIALSSRLSFLGIPLDAPTIVFRLVATGQSAVADDRAFGRSARAASNAAARSEDATASRAEANRTSPATAAAARARAAVDGERDSRLVGTWSYSSSYTSGTFTAATRTLMQFAPDGSVVEGGGRVVGGGATSAFDSGTGGATSAYRWRTQNGVLYVSEAAGGAWQPLARYEFGGGGSKMLFTYNDGSRRIWYRQ